MTLGTEVPRHEKGPLLTLPPELRDVGPRPLRCPVSPAGISPAVPGEGRAGGVPSAGMTSGPAHRPLHGISLYLGVPNPAVPGLCGTGDRCS